MNLVEALQPKHVAALVQDLDSIELLVLCQIAARYGIGLSELRFIVDTLEPSERKLIASLIAPGDIDD